MIVKLSSCEAAAVYNDMRNIMPDWTTATRSPFRRLSFVRLNDKVLQDPVIDENNNVVEPEQLAGETRYDVVVPDDFDLPELQTRVFPSISDHQIY